MKVRNMTSSSGRQAANQYIIQDGNKTYFQSYNSTIAMIDHARQQITLDEYYWDYSVTTGKYRNMFLGEKKNITQKKIDSGEYRTGDLN